VKTSALFPGQSEANPGPKSAAGSGHRCSQHPLCSHQLDGLSLPRLRSGRRLGHGFRREAIVRTARILVFQAIRQIVPLCVALIRT
jgi:hypothetical protein